MPAILPRSRLPGRFAQQRLCSRASTSLLFTSPEDSPGDSYPTLRQAVISQALQGYKGFQDPVHLIHCLSHTGTFARLERPAQTLFGRVRLGFLIAKQSSNFAVDIPWWPQAALDMQKLLQSDCSHGHSIHRHSGSASTLPSQPQLKPRSFPCCPSLKPFFTQQRFQSLISQAVAVGPSTESVSEADPATFADAASPFRSPMSSRNYGTPRRNTNH